MQARLADRRRILLPRKLIEVALPLEAVNAAGRAEKSVPKKGHPATMHLWWSRKPLGVTRAALFASLVEDPSARPDLYPTEADQDAERRRLLELVGRLARWENSGDAELLAEARRCIEASSAGGELPRVADPFCGGGSIPLETLRLGLDALAVDLNPVAALVTTATVSLAQRFPGQPAIHPRAHPDRLPASTPASAAPPAPFAGIAADVAAYGEAIEAQCRRSLADVFAPVAVSNLPVGDHDGQPGYSEQSGYSARIKNTAQPGRTSLSGQSGRPELSGDAGVPGNSADAGQSGHTAVSYLWARTIRCVNPACRRSTPLLSTWTLSRKPTNRWHVRPDIGGERLEFVVAPGPPPAGLRDLKAGRGANYLCVYCAGPNDAKAVRAHGRESGFGLRLVAVQAFANPRRRRGRTWLSPTPALEQAGLAGLADSCGPGRLSGFSNPAAPGAPAGLSDLAEPAQQIGLDELVGLPGPGERSDPADSAGLGGLSDPAGSDELGGLPWSDVASPGFSAAPGVAPEQAGLASPAGFDGLVGPDGVSPGFSAAVEAALERRLPAASGNITSFGVRTFGDLLTPRQQRTMATFSEAIRAIRPVVYRDAVAAGMPDDGLGIEEGGSGAVAYADAVTTYLALTLSRMANRTTTMTVHNRSNGSVEQSFVQPAYAFYGDFPEANPFSGSTGSWANALSFVVAAIQSLPLSPIEAPRPRPGPDAAGVNGLINRRAVPGVVAVDVRCSSALSELGRAGGSDGDAGRVGGDGGNPAVGVVVCTDPPYYDMFDYASLSNLFHVWLRATLGDVWPRTLATLLAPVGEQITSNAAFFDGDRAAAHEHFESQLRRVFERIAEVQDPRYPVTVYYGYQQVTRRRSGKRGQGARSDAEAPGTAWEALLESLIGAGLRITATWPLRTERPEGVKKGTKSLASSILLVCRPAAAAESPSTALTGSPLDASSRPPPPAPAASGSLLAAAPQPDAPHTPAPPVPEVSGSLPVAGSPPTSDYAPRPPGAAPRGSPAAVRRLATLGEFRAALRDELPAAVKLLQDHNIAPVDLVQAAIGPGMAIFTRYDRVLRADGSPVGVRTALEMINDVLDETLTGTGADLDAATRWALTWFDEYGFGEGPFGRAEQLSKARNTSVAALEAEGIITTTAAQVRLRHPTELTEAGDHLGAWQATHRLLHYLFEGGETAAANYLRRLPPDTAGAAHDLAYLLFEISARQNRPQEAADYNALVTAWPQLTHLATHHRTLF